MFRFVKNLHRNCSITRTFAKKFSSEQETQVPAVEKAEPSMTPKNIVEYLNDFIIGQQDAKRSMAIALSRPELLKQIILHRE